jgi:hypothetical protein
MRLLKSVSTSIHYQPDHVKETLVLVWERDSVTVETSHFLGGYVSLAIGSTTKETETIEYPTRAQKEYYLRLLWEGP